MDLDVIIETFPDYMKGLVLTIELLGGALLLGLILASVVAVMRVSASKILNVTAWSFTYTFRGTPLLVQMYLIYYGMGQFLWVRESYLWFFFEKPYFCALLALTLNNAAYTAEIFYNALIRLPREELEACYAFGMKRRTVVMRFIVPTVMRLSVQAYSNEVIFMLHATAMVSLITLLDITGVARVVYARFYTPFEAFIVAGILYLSLTLVITFVFRKLEQRMLRHLQTRGLS
ncbi:amino acid ABC transporter permease [Spirochaetota bacterium]|nr:amino acid ABC transporter permease [Spirochaetota bacterium]